MPPNVPYRLIFLGGGFIGTVEEGFFTKMKPTDVFWFGGRPLEIIRITAGEVLVKKASKGKGSIAWSSRKSRSMLERRKSVRRVENVEKTH